MTAPSKPRIFLSYARSDLAFARKLRERLIAEGLDPPWHDQTHMSAGEWWDQIEVALTSPACEHVILVLSPAALAEKRHLVVKREWKLARREGKTVLPVVAPGGLGLGDRDLMPGWMNATHAFDFEGADGDTQWSNLIAELKKPGRQSRRPFMALAMPEGFVARPEEFAKLKAALLDTKGNAVAITAALRGAGGFGKTVLAQVLAHDDDLQDAFYDGVLWVTLGERPSLVEKLADLLKTLTGEPQGFTEVSAAANKLREVLAERKCLLVIDDVWSESHLRPFVEGAPLTARLVTTRRDDILPKGTMCVLVDAMKEAEAVALLSQGLGVIGPAEQMALRTLATERLGEWPVIIRLVNGFLRKEVERCAAPLDAIRQANDRLDRKKLTVFDRNDEAAREAAVESTIRASVDYLVEEIGLARARFTRLLMVPSRATRSAWHERGSRGS